MYGLEEIKRMNKRSSGSVRPTPLPVYGRSPAMMSLPELRWEQYKIQLRREWREYQRYLIANHLDWHREPMSAWST